MNRRYYQQGEYSSAIAGKARKTETDTMLKIQGRAGCGGVYL
jgi:hypothetical protein